MNYELPPERETYIHRIGRTGRAGLSGMAISLVESWEQRELEQIEKLLQLPIAQLALPTAQEIADAEPAFRAKMDAQPEEKGGKHAALHANILKLQIAETIRPDRYGRCGEYTFPAPAAAHNSPPARYFPHQFPALPHQSPPDSGTTLF